MTDAAWLETRRPRPPEDLGKRLRGAHGLAAELSEPPEGLLSAATSALTRALDQPGRVRDAAFDLLAADALVTYACEAALEGDHPDRALDRLISIGRDA